MSDFHLCEVGHRLYMDWSAALDERRKADASRLRREYFEHRKKCLECTKPGKVPEYDHGEG